MKHPDTRDSLVVEAAQIISHEACAGAQYILRVHAPRSAARAQPGNFAHVQCHPMLPMRRPISIMRVDAEQGWVEFLYKAVGEGTRLLAQRQVPESISIIAPVGNQFMVAEGPGRPLLIGGGVGMPPMVFLAQRLRQRKALQPFVVLGSEVPFPFVAIPSRIMVPGVPSDVIAAMPLLDDWGIASRLASQQDYAGVYRGYVTDLARQYVQSLSATQRAQVTVYACGPHAMLAAVAALAREFNLPCQVSLEEYMACAVGGCAGCVVPVTLPEGKAMKRVCVDGPVFDAGQVFS